MIIAAFPNTNLKLSSIWSQLQCLTGDIDEIIIAADPQFREDVMPAIGVKLKAQFFLNDRYDAGLWCDTLIKGNVISNGTDKNSFVGTPSQYDRFLLINDSVMAMDTSNELLRNLKSMNASLVSFNYWGNKENSNITKNDVGTRYWLESVARAFSLEA